MANPEEIATPEVGQAPIGTAAGPESLNGAAALTRRSESTWPLAITGLLFWLVAIGAGVFLFAAKEQAAIFLDAGGSPPSLQGRVVYKGAAPDGILHLRASDEFEGRLIDSATVEVHGGVIPATPIRGVIENQPLRVRAEFDGVYRTEKNQVRDVSGETAIFLNVAPPVSTRSAAWILVGLAAFGVVLTSLITGHMGFVKANLLFAFMYFSTLLSLVLPAVVSVWVAHNPYLRDMLANAPVGLVLARAENAREPQWLINIGGHVFEGVRRTSAANQEQAATAAGSSGAVASGSAEKTKGEAITPSGKVTDDVDSPNEVMTRVEGGLTVPFFVIMLALFGAGVNLTRKVPEIQKKYFVEVKSESAVTSFFKATGKALTHPFRYAPRTEDPVAAQVREDLVTNFMYFAAAPFLAIAVYYVLRLAATEVTQPALVIAAFATGLISDKIVQKVIELGEQAFKSTANTAANGGGALRDGAPASTAVDKAPASAAVP